MGNRTVWIMEEQTHGDYQERTIIGVYGSISKAASAFTKSVNYTLKATAENNITGAIYRTYGEGDKKLALQGKYSDDWETPQNMIDHYDNNWLTPYAVKNVKHTISLVQGDYEDITVQLPQVKVGAVKAELLIERGHSARMAYMATSTGEYETFITIEEVVVE